MQTINNTRSYKINWYADTSDIMHVIELKPKGYESI
jgi:hypothetical protein